MKQRARFGSLSWAYTAGFALGGMQIGTHALHDNSFFVHLVTGRWIVDHGAVPHHDVYSFTAAGRPFIAQSWLPELLYGVLERDLGAWAIRLMMGLVAATIAVSAFRLTLRIAGGLYRSVAIALAAFVVIGAMYSERPLAFGLLAFVALLWIVEVPDSRLGRHPVLALVAVLWLWGNSHGSVALGIGYLLLHVVGAAIEGRRPVAGSRERSLVLGLGAALVALCANPYGPRLLWFPIALLGRGDVLADVVEWMSPDFHSTAGKAFALWLVVGALVVLRGRRPGWRDLLVGTVFVLLALWALRNLAIAVVVTLPIVARSARRESVEDVSESSNALTSVIVGLLVVVTAMIGLRATTGDAYDLRGYSRRAMRSVEQASLLGRRLFTTDANAGWVLARSWPTQRVFMDDRYDMFPDAVIRDYQRIAGVEPGWDRALDEHGVDYVVWPRRRSLTQALALSPKWRRLAESDPEWDVFIRADVRA